MALGGCAFIPINYTTLLAAVLLLTSSFLFLAAIQNGLTAAIGQRHTISGQISLLWNVVLVVLVLLACWWVVSSVNGSSTVIRHHGHADRIRDATEYISPSSRGGALAGDNVRIENNVPQGGVSGRRLKKWLPMQYRVWRANADGQHNRPHSLKATYPWLPPSVFRLRSFFWWWDPDWPHRSFEFLWPGG